MMSAASPQRARFCPLGHAMRWLAALLLVALAGPAHGEIAYILQVNGVSRGDTLSGTVDINADVVGEADFILFELSGPTDFTVVRQGDRPSLMVDPETGENAPLDTTTMPNGRYFLKVTAVVENGNDRSRIVRFWINNTLTDTEQNDTVSAVDQPSTQPGTHDVEVDTDPVDETEEVETDDPTPATRPQVVVVNDDDQDDALVTLLGSLEEAAAMPGVSFADAPNTYTRGSNQPIRVGIDGVMPEDGDVLAIAWSVTESRMVDAFSVRLDPDNPRLPAEQLDLLPAGEVQLQLLVRRASQIHQIVRQSLRVVVPEPVEPDVVLPTLELVDAPDAMTHGQLRDLRVQLGADLPDGADVLVLAWSEEEKRIVEEFTFVMGGDLRIPASAMDLLPSGPIQLQLLTRLEGKVKHRTTHTMTLLDPPAPTLPETVALPAIGFDSPPATYTHGSGRSIAIRASGEMPDDADVVVVAWSSEDQAMVEAFAHTLDAGEWTISADKLAALPTGGVNLQLLVRHDRQVKAIVSHPMTVQPEPIVVQPEPEPQPEPAVRPAVQFAQTPDTYTQGSGQSIAIAATSAFPEGSDLLVIAWSSEQKRLVDEFAFSMSQGTLAIPAAKLDLLPQGNVVLQLLPREGGKVYGQVTHTLAIRPSADSGAGGGDTGNEGSGGSDGSTGEDTGPDAGTDPGTDPDPGTEPEPEPEPEVYNLAFASGAAAVYQRGSGASIPLTVSNGLPGGSTVQLRAWSLDDGAYVAAFDTTLGSGPWRVGAHKLDQLADGRYRIDAALRVSGQDPVGVSHHVTVLSPSGEGEEVSPSAVYPGFTTYQPSADTTVIYVSSSTGNDDNDGLSPQTAVRTPERGVDLLRDGKPDWLLFHRGDTFRGGLGRWTKSGRSSGEPMIIGSYGDANAARPKFYTDGDGLIESAGPDPVSYVVFSDLHGYANERDPDSRDFDDGRSVEVGVWWRRAGREVRFENMLLEFFANAINVGQRTEYDVRDITLHRCVLRNSYLPWDKGHSQGLFADRVTGLTITECVFDHNGWNEQVYRAKRTGFNQNVYIYQCTDIHIEGTVFARGSNMGLKIRSDRAGITRNVLVRGNLFVGNLTGLKIGSDPNGDQDRTVHENVTFTGNVFTDNGGPLPGGTVLGNAIVIEQTDLLTVSDNLFIDKLQDTNWYAINVNTWLPVGRITIERNIVHRWEAREPLINDQGADESSVSLRGNMVEVGDSRYTDASLSFYGYIAGHGCPDVDALVDALANHRKADASVDLFAGAIVDHLRDGFELTPFD